MSSEAGAKMSQLRCLVDLWCCVLCYTVIIVAVRTAAYGQRSADVPFERHKKSSQ